MSRVGQRKRLDEFVIAWKFIDLPRPPSWRDVFDRRAHEHERPMFLIEALEGELIDESLYVELAQYEFLCRLIVTDESNVLVNFSLRVLFLRRIDRLIRDLNELVPQRECVAALRLAVTGLAADIALPVSDERSNRPPDISFRIIRVRIPRERKGCAEQKCWKQ